MMFQLGSLVVLCNLLSGTLASLSDVLQNLNLDVGSLQETTDWSLAKNNILEALNTLDLGRLNLSSQNDLGLRIKKLSILNLQACLSSNGKGIDMKLPVVVDASVSLPPNGSMVDVAISLDLITSLTVETYAQTGLPMLALTKCSNDADSIITSSVGRLIPMASSDSRWHFSLKHDTIVHAKSACA